MSTLANISNNRDDKRALVVVFLRGGADGLSLVVPTEDDNYYRARPRLALKKAETLKLDDRFGLNPLLSPLEAAWKEGDLAIAHAAGCEDTTRSHFEAQDLMEHGGFVAGGWLARFLRARGPATSPLSAVALSPTMPEVLSGAPSAAAFQRIEEFGLRRRYAPKPGEKSKQAEARKRGDEDERLAMVRFAEQLRRLSDKETGAFKDAASNTFDAVRKLEAIDLGAAPGNGAIYEGKDSFHQGLRQTAQLIKADVGLDAASVDLNGWDTHFTQDIAITGNIRSLGSGLAAFRKDMGARMATTTVVVMTEFGRRLGENTSLGTDHGRGSVMFAMGGGVSGGRMLGAWNGLTREMLEDPGDLPVWNNYRDILAPILAKHGAPADSFGKIFPDYALTPLPVYA
jgi:uncharacterized protein (DUF1501 family)